MLRNLIFAIVLGFCVGLVPAEENTAPADPRLGDLRAAVAADPDDEDARRKLAMALFA